MKVLVLNSREDADRIYGDALAAEGLCVEYRATPSVHPESLLDLTTPDLILLSLEWLPGHRIIAAEAIKKKIPVLYVMDGVLEWSYIWNNQSYVSATGTVLQPLVASDLAVLGRHPARILASMGLGGRTHVVGLPRLDHFPRSRLLDLDVHPTVIVSTARTPSHNLDQEAHVLLALSDLKRVMCDLGIRSIWRIPATMAGELGVEASSGELNHSLREASAVITLPSTLALEAMLAGLPTAILEYRPTPLYFESAWQIRAKDHIYPVLNELLHPPSEKMAYQEFCLREELEPGVAGERLLRLMKAIVDRGVTTEHQPCTPEKGFLDYKLVHSQISSFSASPNATIQYEVDAHRAFRKLIKNQFSELGRAWQIKLLRQLRALPTFKKLNRILDFYLSD